MDHEDEELEPEEFPLADSLDVTILMHRDVHFGGQFDIMLEYYEKGGKGADEEFELERIRELQKIEQNLKANLAATLLSGADAERVGLAKSAYKKLRSMYVGKATAGNKIPRLIADLILAEEEETEAALEAVIAEKSAIVPALLELVRSEDFHDPLFPGYGFAPVLAIKALGKIGDKRAIISLFESIGESDFFSDDLALEALQSIGAPAKEFLLRVLHSRPITFDNERAAMALLQFKDEPEVAKACFEMLKGLDLKKHALLSAHLALACSGLPDEPSRQEFIALGDLSTTPSTLRLDIKAIAKSWK